LYVIIGEGRTLKVHTFPYYNKYKEGSLISMIDVLPEKKWQKRKRPSTWRYSKMYVHKTIRGKGIVIQLFRRRR